MWKELDKKQWILGGNCEKCERRYCHTGCEAYKRFWRKNIHKKKQRIKKPSTNKLQSLYKNEKVGTKGNKMNEKIVINWVDNVLKLAEDGYNSSSVTKKEEIFMELVGVCDSFLKIFNCDCRYDFSKCEKRVYSFKVRNTMIDWILEVIDCVMEGLKVENNTNMNKWFKYIMGVCKTIYMVFGCASTENKVEKTYIQDIDNMEKESKRREVYLEILNFWKMEDGNEISIWYGDSYRTDTIARTKSRGFFHSLSGKDFNSIESCACDYVKSIDFNNVHGDLRMMCTVKGVTHE